MTTKQALIDRLRVVFQSWETTLQTRREDEITAPLRPGGWSISEVIAHLSAWQQISIAHLEAALRNTDPSFPPWLGGADPFFAEDHVDEFNARIQESRRSQSWSKRQRDWREGFLRFLTLAERVPDSLLFENGRCPWLRGHALYTVLEGSCEHHQHHLDQLQAVR